MGDSAGETPQLPPDDALPPAVHSFEVTGFSEQEAIKEAQAHLREHERLVDIKLVKQGRS